MHAIAAAGRRWAGPSTHWLLGLTPFGWVERMPPFTENDVAPLLLAVVAVAVVVTLAPAAGSCAAGLALFRHRDVHRDELEAGTRRCECPRPGNEM